MVHVRGHERGSASNWKKVNARIWLQRGSDRGIAIRKFPEGFDVSYGTFAGNRKDVPQYNLDDIYYNFIAFRTLKQGISTEIQARSFVKSWLNAHSIEEIIR